MSKATEIPKSKTVECEIKIVEYVEVNSLCAVPGHVSRLTDTEQTVLTDARMLFKNTFVFSFSLFVFFLRSFDRKGR